MMLKRLMKPLFSALLGTALLWTAPAFAAGTLPLAMAQQIDINGRPLAGCQVSFFVAGTVSSPQNAFADFSLTQALPNPLSCDQSGRVPMFWLADGLIHVRLTDSSGLQVIDTTMQVLGPSSGGGGGGGTVDPTAIIGTGDMKAKYGTGPLTGFVRANGLTIGNATCGCTERANADTQNLFVYLYGADPNLVVSGGRTGNALNDFNASKQLTLPDFRSRALAGLGDMGNSDNALFAGVTFTTGTSTTLGSLLGAARRTLLTANLPPYTPSGSVGTTINGGSGNQGLQSGTGGLVNIGGTGSGGTNVPLSASSTFTGTPAPGQTSAAFDAVSPFGLLTIYVKL